MNTAKPNVFEFSNFREYLKAFYNHSKAENASFSHRYFAKKAELGSPNFLHLIMGGKRNLTKDYLPKFAGAIGMSKKEHQYFEALVNFNQAGTPEAKRYYLELLHNLKKEKTGTALSDGQYEYISRWYYAAIRELVMLTDFSEDPDWIKRKLRSKISFYEARDGLETLIRLGLLKRNEEGRLVQADIHLITDDDVQGTASYMFHQQMLTLAKEILASENGQHREISGVTMAISQRQFKDIKARIAEFEDSILKYLSDNPDPAESVFQMNVQLFSLTNGHEANGRTK